MMMKVHCALQALVCIALGQFVAATVDYRPQCHVMPKTNWMNDPNGPMYFNGNYHLFFQYNPNGATWGDMHWGHAVSPDLVHWQHLPIALAPDHEYDKNGVFSGSATSVNGSPVISYTCVDSQNFQAQCLAYPADPSDPNLTEWTKPSSNPVIPLPPDGKPSTLFRDDTTGWRSNDEWLMAVGYSLNGDGSIEIYNSSDFKSWDHKGTLWTRPGYGDMWECPDFFNVTDTVWVAKISALPERRDRSALGIYDEGQQKFHQQTELVLYDYGNKWYASKSFWDPIGQRHIVWGWLDEDDPSGASRGWQGVQSFPREIVYDENLNRILMRPIEELQQLHEQLLFSTAAMSIPAGGMKFLQNAQGNQLHVHGVFGIPQQVAEAAAQPGVPLWSMGFAIAATDDGTQRTDVTVAQFPATGPFNNTDMPGAEYRQYPLPEGVDEALNVQNCSRQCEAEEECVAWTYVRKGDPVVPRCSLKNGFPNTVSNSFCVSGTVGQATFAINRSKTGGDGNPSTESGYLPLLPSDSSITIDIWVDHSMIEAFAEGGRARIASRIYPSREDAKGVAIIGAATATVQATDIEVHSLSSIWE